MAASATFEEAAAATANNFKNKFSEIIQEGPYSCHQVFNADETTLFWKTMPMQDRLSLLFCANTSGDLKVKPMLVYKHENPRSFRENHVIKSELPVMWKSNTRAWVTRPLFMDWMHNVFAPTVRNYLEEKGLPIKCLLILDNGPAHPPSLLVEELQGDLEFIKVKFLPPNTSPLLQPMDQQVIASFKKLYTLLYLLGVLM